MEELLEHLTQKYGPAAAASFSDPNNHLNVAGRKVGIQFKSNRKIYPTQRAHSIIEYTKQTFQDNDKANHMMENLYQRYFENGENINDEEVLKAVIKTFYSDQAQHQTKLEQIMTDPTAHQLILQKDTFYKNRMNIHGVPFFIIHPKDGSTPTGFSGAQPPSVIAEELREAADAS